MIAGDFEISTAFLIYMLAALVAPVWYGAILTVVAYLVVRRRGAGDKMLGLGVTTTVVAFITWLAGVVILGGSGAGLFFPVACLATESMAIVVGAVCCWYRPILRFRSPRAR